MQANQLKISFGQAYSSQEQQTTNASLLVAQPKIYDLGIKGVAAIIADSTGRSLMAQQAARISTKGFMIDYYSTPDSWTIKKSATRVLRALNSWLHSQNKQVDNGGYICSMSALVLHSNQMHLFHVGDTLVYRLRGSDCQLLNQEHTTFLGGYRYPSRAMGMDPRLDLDYLNASIKQGDLFLFTTQAVKGTLVVSDLVHLVGRYAEDLYLTCEQILQAALEKSSARGYSSHNFCFQLLRVDQVPQQASKGLASAYSSLPLPEELYVNAEIDGYKVLQVLSRSATSRVYKVQDPVSQQPVILKAPSPQIARRKELLTHFAMQQWIAESLSSPYMAKAVVPERAPTQMYYLMEYVEGRTLDEWMRTNAAADIQVKIDLIEQLAKVVRSLHRHEVLVQNLNPHNVLVTSLGLIKLVDLSACGRPKAAGLPPVTNLARRAGLTVYSAPEYSLGYAPTERADQYSLAAIAYELFTGQLPYAGKLVGVKGKTALAKLTYQPAVSLNPDLPAWLDWPLRKALQPDPDLRYRRLSEFVYDLKKPNLSLLVPAEANKQPRNGWKWLAWLLLLLLVLSWLW